MPETTTRVEDDQLKRLLDGKPPNKINYSKPPKPQLRSEHELLLKLMPHIEPRQAGYLVDALYESFSGVKEIDDSIREIFVNAWKSASIEEEIRAKQRLQKSDLINLQFLIKENIMQLLKLIIGIHSKLYVKNLSTQAIGDTVIRYSYKE